MSAAPFNQDPKHTSVSCSDQENKRAIQPWAYWTWGDGSELFTTRIDDNVPSSPIHVGFRGIQKAREICFNSLHIKTEHNPIQEHANYITPLSPPSFGSLVLSDIAFVSNLPTAHDLTENFEVNEELSSSQERMEEPHTLMQIEKDTEKLSEGSHFETKGQHRPLCRTTLAGNRMGQQQQQELQRLMRLSQLSQAQLQEWDKRIGLPKSHSSTMMNTNRSRRQLREGRIIFKSNGTPLIPYID